MEKQTEMKSKCEIKGNEAKISRITCGLNYPKFNIYIFVRSFITSLFIYANLTFEVNDVEKKSGEEKEQYSP